MKPFVRLGWLWLLAPTLILALVFRRSERFLISDDVAYWGMAFDWRDLFREQGFWKAIPLIHAWQYGRATFHPLLILPFFTLTHSIPRSVVALGLAASAWISTSLFRIFRSLGLEEKRALAAAVTVATLPLLLSQARFFMTEYSFAACLLAALAALLEKRLLWFALAYAAALLIRPVEGAALLPGFIFFYATKYSFQESFRAPLLLASGGAFLLATLGFVDRLQKLKEWFLLGTFPNGQGEFFGMISIHRESLPFAWNKIFLFFGITGIALFLFSALVLILAKSRAAAVAHLLQFMLLVSFLVFCRALEDPNAWAACYRFALGFALFFMISSCYWALKNKWGIAVIALVLAANLSVYRIFLFEEDIGPSEATNASFLYNYSLVHSINEPGRVPSLMGLLQQKIPQKKENVRILVSGRDSDLFANVEELNLASRSQDLNWEFSPTFPAPYLNEIFEETGGAGDYGVDFVVFAQRPLYSSMRPFPNPLLVEKLEKGRPEDLGFTFLAPLETPGMQNGFLLFASASGLKLLRGK